MLMQLDRMLLKYVTCAQLRMKMLKIKNKTSITVRQRYLSNVVKHMKHITPLNMCKINIRINASVSDTQASISSASGFLLLATIMYHVATANPV